MQADYYRMLYDYDNNCWARDRLFAAATGMSDAEFAKPNGFTYGSIRGILTHMLDADALWLARRRQETPNRITEDLLPNLSALRARWLDEEARIPRASAFSAGGSSVGAHSCA
ncbi:MAG: hypothetical protein NTZ05_22160, partial [Chloroflexi bacterium]|nr:hypothetical protein [Chloroflexota bacterium]